MLLDQEAKDALKLAVNSAIDAVALAPAPDESGLQAQLDAANAANADLQKKNDDAAASLAAEVSKEADLQAQSDAKSAMIQKALADLGVAPAAPDAPASN